MNGEERLRWDEVVDGESGAERRAASKLNAAAVRRANLPTLRLLQTAQLEDSTMRFLLPTGVFASARGSMLI